MNKEITKQDIIDIFAQTCPEVNMSEEEIKNIGEKIFEPGTPYNTVRGFMLHKVFVTAISELYNKVTIQ